MWKTQSRRSKKNGGSNIIRISIINELISIYCMISFRKLKRELNPKSWLNGLSIAKVFVAISFCSAAHSFASIHFDKIQKYIKWKHFNIFISTPLLSSTCAPRFHFANFLILILYLKSDNIARDYYSYIYADSFICSHCFDVYERNRIIIRRIKIYLLILSRDNLICLILGRMSNLIICTLNMVYLNPLTPRVKKFWQQKASQSDAFSAWFS